MFCFIFCKRRHAQGEKEGDGCGDDEMQIQGLGLQVWQRWDDCLYAGQRHGMGQTLEGGGCEVACGPECGIKAS